MKKYLYGNYVLVLMTWVLFLNFLEVPSMVVLCAYSVYVFMKIKNKNIWRIVSLSIFIFMFCEYILTASNIDIYFPMISFLLLFLSINVAVNIELMTKLDCYDIYPSYFIMIVIMFIFYAIAMILPNDWYSLFTKSSLYTMISFIFLPLGLSESFVLLSKELPLDKRNYLKPILNTIKSRN